MKSKLAWWPWAVAGILFLWAVAALFPKPDRDLAVQEFGRLPVLLNGRVQPFDSVARNTLLQIRGKQTAPVKLHFSVFDPAKRGQTISAMEWLLQVMIRPEDADRLKVFRIDHPELIALLKLPGPDEDQGEDGKHFSFNQIKPLLEELEVQGRRAAEKEPGVRSAFERQTFKLYQAILLYHRLKNSLQPESTHHLLDEVEAYRQAIPPGVAAARAREAGQAFDQEAFNRLVQSMQRFEIAARAAYPLTIPPTRPTQSRDAWESMGTALLESARAGDVPPPVLLYARMSQAYHDRKVDEFNRAVAEYHGWLEKEHAGELRKGRAEIVYNYFQPFYRALVLYLVAFLMVCAYWVRQSENLRRAAVWVSVVGLVVHSAGLLYRMVLEGRPPVTNLYSSAIFIGWGSAILGLILERLHRIGLGTAVASLVGFLTLIVAHNLSLGGDTMEMMRAVLDSNFWLATHVVTITMGYSANFAAGMLGIFFILLGLFTRLLDEATAEVVSRLIYGIICFATLFSFVGTVLGGIWADQSWGRFWGWDPKENGALLIVLWNAAILHARWSGSIRERGLAATAVFGNIVTSFSWFGVNMLGVGLHSYGFMDAAFKWLLLFVVSQVILIGLSCVPLEHWRSFLRPAVASGGSPSPRAPSAGS